MLAIFLVWLINLTVAAALGSMLQAFLFKNDHKIIDYLLINGLFVYMIVIWLILYFKGFGLYFQVLSFILALIYIILQPRYLKILWQAFKNLSHLYKSLFYLTSLIVLMLSSATSSLPDNESYYIQTIKWANEQGLIKGLINIHPFLGQFSGWHILQAGFNFHQKLISFNDLNGLFFLIFIFYWLLREQKDWNPKKYWLRLFPVVSALLIFFIDSPSPDLPVILLSLLVFDLFIRNYQQLNRPQFIEILLLSGFSFLIKPTAIVNVILVLILWWRHRKQLCQMSLKIILFGLFVLSLWLSKNYRITGYLFYPFDIFGNYLKSAWQYPPELLQYMAHLGKQENMALSANNHLLTGFWHWLRQAGMHQIINPLIVLLFLLFPAILVLKKPENILHKPYWLLYLLGWFYFISMLFVGPNFRFFLAIFIFLALSIKAFLSQPVFYKYFNALGWGLFLAVGIYGVIHHHWQYKNLLIPQPVSSLNARFYTKKEGDLQYHYPDDEQLFWQTGDAPLPAVHQKQIDFFKNKFGFVPQKNIKKNFYYSERVKHSK